MLYFRARPHFLQEAELFDLIEPKDMEDFNQLIAEVGRGKVEILTQKEFMLKGVVVKGRDGDVITDEAEKVYVFVIYNRDPTSTWVRRRRLTHKHVTAESAIDKAITRAADTFADKLVGNVKSRTKQKRQQTERAAKSKKEGKIVTLAPPMLPDDDEPDGDE